MCGSSSLRGCRLRFRFAPPLLPVFDLAPRAPLELVEDSLGRAEVVKGKCVTTELPFCKCSIHGGEVVPFSGDLWSGGEVGAGAAFGELPQPNDQSVNSCTMSWCIFCLAIVSGVLSILSAILRLA